MKRIDTSDRAVALFGAGKDGFKEQVPGVSLATQVNAQWFNMIQEAIVRTIEAAGLELSAADFDQFTLAVQALIDQVAAGKVTQGGGEGQIDGVVKIGAAAAGKLKAEAAGIDLGNFAFEAWVLGQLTEGLAGKEPAFASGTQMLFVQSAAPVGWTKVTTHDNKALRVVSGVAGSGGTVDFTAAFVNGSTGGHVLTIAEMPSHTHTDGVHTILLRPPYAGSITGGDTTNSGSEQAVGVGDGAPIPNIGDDGAHSHTINLDVRYVDVIIASKD